MKSILILVCTVILNSAVAQTQFAEFSFQKKIQNLDPVIAGEPLHIYYQFTNSGRVPLIITEAKVDCSCTVVDFPMDPIQPGNYGTIKVTFDTNEKIGWQYRKVRLFANTKKKVDEIEFRVKVE